MKRLQNMMEKNPQNIGVWLAPYSKVAGITAKGMTIINTSKDIWRFINKADALVIYANEKFEDFNEAITKAYQKKGIPVYIRTDVGTVLAEAIEEDKEEMEYEKPAPIAGDLTEFLQYVDVPKEVISDGLKAKLSKWISMYALPYPKNEKEWVFTYSTIAYFIKNSIDIELDSSIEYYDHSTKSIIRYDHVEEVTEAATPVKCNINKSYRIHHSKHTMNIAQYKSVVYPKVEGTVRKYAKDVITIERTKVPTLTELRECQAKLAIMQAKHDITMTKVNASLAAKGL
jgi:hypothetical protein